VAGVGGAAVLYAPHHIGYGMGLRETVFLLGLGVVYSTALTVVRNVVVLRITARSERRRRDGTGRVRRGGPSRRRQPR
jgi:hypothetical protein